MCGRYTLASTPQRVAEHFALAELPELDARYNVAPGQDVPVVRSDRSGGRQLEARRWGLVPHWSNPGQGARMINARVESVVERPAFRGALRLRRCLIPADGFYEWTGSARRRRPHHIRLPGGALFAFAGIYERWHGAGGEVIDSCALLTTEAGPRVRALHDRMPVVLPPERYADWLDRGLRAPAPLLALLASLPEPPFEAHAVSSQVNDVRHDAPDCLAPPEPEPEDPQPGLDFGA